MIVRAMRNLIQVTSLCCLLTSCCMVPQPENVYTFEEGVDDCECFEDTSIFSESQNAGGATDGIFSGTTAQLHTRRALLKVDLSSIPPGTVITNVELRVTVEMSGDSFADIAYALHPVSRPWGEGTVRAGANGGFGGPANPGDATWTDARLGEVAWTTPGGDFDPEPSAVANAGFAGQSATWSGAGLVKDVQRWVNAPEENHGWIIIGALEGQKKRVKRFYSSDAPGNRPRLVVEVAPAIGKQGLTIFGLEVVQR
jgi:hypothetical protein